MRVAALILVFTFVPLPAIAEEGPADKGDAPFVDKETGLVVRLPDEWDRVPKREKGSFRLVAMVDFTPSRYVMLTIEVGPSAGYDEDAWLEVERKAVEEALKEVTKPFETDPILIDDQIVQRYSIAGRVEPKDGKPYEMRVRACGLVSGVHFFKVSEVSFDRAHEKAIDAVHGVWESISFDPAVVDAGRAPDAIDTSPPEGDPQIVTDATGNFRLLLPPGWAVERAPPDKANAKLRLRVVRLSRGGEQLLRLHVFRNLVTRAEAFSVETASDRMERLRRNGSFEQFYGEGSVDFAMPQFDESTLLGEIEKSGSYECRSVTLMEDQLIREAEKLIARGDKEAKVPEFAPLVVRGRVAMLSPYAYHAFAVFERAVSDDEPLLKDYASVLDSWEFLDATPLPQPLLDEGKPFGDTTADPALDNTRKEKHVHSVKSKRTTYRLRLEYGLPPGFQRLTKGLPEDTSLLVVAHDARNNWVRIRVRHTNLTAWGDDHPNKLFGRGRKDICETWRSNWTSRARGVKRMKKPRGVRLGRAVDGDGYKFVEGDVEGFRGTFTGVVTAESTWWNYFEMETRGDGDKVFKKGIKSFFRSLKLEKE